MGKGGGGARERERELSLQMYLFILQFLINESDTLYPEHLFEDVQRAVFEVHHSRQITTASALTWVHTNRQLKTRRV